jgi:hypothetical protein
MTKTGTIVKAMQAVLLVTVLTPATVYADPLSTRQMLAQAQTQSQDQAVKGEVKRINRGLILGTAEAATNSNAQRPVEIPAISTPAPTTPAPALAVEAPQVEIPALPPRHDEAPASAATDGTFSTAAAPSASTSVAQTSSIVTLPAPAQPATDTTAPVTTSAPAATDAATMPAPVAPVATNVPVTATVTTPVATTTTAKVDTATSSANTSSTKTTQASHQSRSRHHSDDSFDVGGFNVSSGDINRQLTKFINRRDVKSILAQFGLN